MPVCFEGKDSVILTVQRAIISQEQQTRYPTILVLEMAKTLGWRNHITWYQEIAEQRSNLSPESHISHRRGEGYKPVISNVGAKF